MQMIKHHLHVQHRQRRMSTPQTPCDAKKFQYIPCIPSDTDSCSDFPQDVRLLVECDLYVGDFTECYSRCESAGTTTYDGDLE